jgi:hypothetical protein
VRRAKPQRTLPRALIGTIGTVACSISSFSCLRRLLSERLEEGFETPLLALGERLIGPAGALILGLAAVFSLAGNLHSNMAATPRVTYAMAERGELPAWLAKVHRDFANSSLIDPVLRCDRGRPRRQRELRLACRDQHARPDDRLCRDHNRASASAAPSCAHRRVVLDDCRHRPARLRDWSPRRRTDRMADALGALSAAGLLLYFLTPRRSAAG